MVSSVRIDTAAPHLTVSLNCPTRLSAGALAKKIGLSGKPVKPPSRKKFFAEGAWLAAIESASRQYGGKGFTVSGRQVRVLVRLEDLRQPDSVCEAADLEARHQ